MDITIFLGAEVTDAEGIAMGEFFQHFEPSLDPLLWLTLVEEELAETLEAIDDVRNDATVENKAALLKEVCDVRVVAVGLNAVMNPAMQFLLPIDSPTRLRLKAVDEALSAIHTDFPVAFPMEVLREAYFRVHRSNMSKLDDSGKPVRREDGKVLKGPNYEAPDLLDLVGG